MEVSTTKELVHWRTWILAALNDWEIIIITITIIFADALCLFTWYDTAIDFPREVGSRQCSFLSAKEVPNELLKFFTASSLVTLKVSPR
jgi:hypothetical protein